MMKKKVLAMMCVATMAMGITACGSEKTAEAPVQQESAQTQETETAAETESEEEIAEGAVFTEDLLFNDADELVAHVPFAPIGSSYAEAMMQVTGYTYIFNSNETTYTLEVAYECGTPGADTTMYMKRDYVFTGNCSVDGDAYILDAPEHFTLTQETAGQFAASSGEGGADYWGPNGISIDETYVNENGYSGLDADKILASFQPCKAIVSGDAVSFEAVEGADAVETTETTETAEATEAE